MKKTTKLYTGIALLAVCMSLGACVACGQTQGFIIGTHGGPNGSIAPQAGYVVPPANPPLVFTAEPNDGYVVAYWTVDESFAQAGGEQFILESVAYDHVVSVFFFPITHQVTPSAGPNGEIYPYEPSPVPDGNSITFFAEPYEGYVVDTWQLDGNDVQTGGFRYTLEGVYEDHTVHVTFMPAGHRIVPSAGLHGSIHPNEPVMVPDGGRYIFTARPDEGYEVDTWYVNQEAMQTGDASFILSDVWEDKVVYVTFQPAHFTIIPMSDWYGTITPNEVFSAEIGSSHTFRAKADPGYTVDRWYVDGLVAQEGGEQFTLSNISDDTLVKLSFRPLLSYSLGLIDFNSVSDFETRVEYNNSGDPNGSAGSMIHVERLEGQSPDPNGYMVLHSLQYNDPNSSDSGKMIPARAKGRFEGTTKDRVLIRFKYLFSVAQPGVELKVHLSNVPQLLDPTDPLYPRHYLQVARLLPPPAGNPGAPGSGTFAVFEELMDTYPLNISQGLWVELELVEPAPSQSVSIDDWNAAVQCYGICLDLNWDNFVDTADFLKVIGECGRAAVGEQACSEGLFSADGMVDSQDIGSWDWALNGNEQLLSFCSIPMVGSSSTTMGTMSQPAAPPRQVADLNDEAVAHQPPNQYFHLPGLWVLGKRGTYQSAGKLQDRLYLFDNEGQLQAIASPEPDRGNTRVLRDTDGCLYVLNTSAGLLSLDPPGLTVIPPASGFVEGGMEPRYHKPATVTVGLQGQGSSVYGRPLLDVALDGEYAYVLPVVVNPQDAEPYLAAAKLKLQAGDTPPYQIVQLFDDPPPANDNQVRDALRELELDDQGNLYVLNAHRLNESDRCWRYKPDGSSECLELGQSNSENYCPAPIAMFAASDGLLYMVSSLLNQADHYTSTIKGFDMQGDVLTLKRTIQIHDMQHIVCINEDKQTGELFVLGFNMDNIPWYPNPFAEPFYFPSLAVVPADQDSTRGQDLIDYDLHDLGLPTSCVMR